LREVFLSWGMLIVSVLFNALGVFIIKLKLNEYGAIPTETLKSILIAFWTLAKSPLVVFGLVLFFLSPFLFTIALSRMEITIAYPVQIALNFLILILLAVLFLNEQLTFQKSFGMLLIFVGIYFLNKTGIYMTRLRSYKA